jgi:hypothetical protein
MLAPWRGAGRRDKRAALLRARIGTAWFSNADGRSCSASPTLSGGEAMSSDTYESVIASLRATP